MKKEKLVFLAIIFSIFGNLIAFANADHLQINQQNDYEIKNTIVSFSKSSTFMITKDNPEKSSKTLQPCKIAKPKEDAFDKETLTIFFDLGKSTIKNEFFPVLNAFSKTYSKGGPLSITGYTCPLGTQQINQSLASKRAENVKDFFQKLGFSSIEATGKEGCCYISEDPHLLYKNRRTEIIYNPNYVKE